MVASPYTVTATYGGDMNYLTTTASDSVTPSAVTLTDVVLNGTVPGKIQSGDSIVVSFSGPINLDVICTGWTGATLTDGVVKVTNGGSDDSISITSASCTPNDNFGTIDLGSPGYVTGSGNKLFSGSTISWSANTLTITLGATRSGGGTLGTVFASSPTYAAGFAIPGSPFQIPFGTQFA